MQQLVLSIRHFCHTEGGVTAIEYALLAALIAVVILASVVSLGGQVGALYSRISAAIASIVPP